MLQMRDYQQECVDHVLSRFAAGGTRVPNVLSTGLGKGHPLETEVPTPRGWRRWGDLEPGDDVFGRDGSSTSVLEVYDRGVLEAYRVTFSDGSSVLVDGDHLWTVRDSSITAQPWGNLETRELAQLELKRSRGWRFHIPMTSPLERKPLELPLDPYVVGALISNGSMVGSGTQLTTPDLEVAARVARATLVNKIRDTTAGVCDRYSLPGLTAVTRELGMRAGSKEKRIPAAYLLGSLEQRLELLHGLMDGDGGGRDTSRRSVAYFTSSEGLARDVSELVTSLGGTGIVKRYDRGAKGVEYAVRILLPSSVPAFGSSRKAGAGTSSVRNLQPKRAIVSVVLEGAAPIRCIQVAARDSLYLIGRQHVVTHNTVIFSHLAKIFIATNRGKRVLVLAWTDELVQQAAAKMRQVAPHLTIGIVKAERNEVSAHVVVASVQSLRSVRRRNALRNVGLIIVDECHHATRRNTYGTILEHFGAFDDICPECGGQCLWPNEHGYPLASSSNVQYDTEYDSQGVREHVGEAGSQAGVGTAGVGSLEGVGAQSLTQRSTGMGGGCALHERGGRGRSGESVRPGVKVAGFTATLARGDKTKLSEAWEMDPAPFVRGIGFGIRRGYLLDVRGKRIVVPDMDLGQVRKQGGDYAEGSLAAELDRALAPQIVAEKYAELAGDRKGLVFTPTVESAEHFAAAFNTAGIPAAVVHGKLGREERRLILKRLATGDVRVVVNCAVLTEGFDDPTISCIVIARPTRSAPLYQQMVGRGLRPDLSLPPDERGDCLVLDVVGASRSHDLRSLVDLSEKRMPAAEELDEELSLLALEELGEEEERRESEGRNVVPPDEYVGQTENVDFDPLGRTGVGAWLTTFGGTYFLPIGRKAYVLIVASEDEPGRWDVGWLTKRPGTFGHFDCSGSVSYARRITYGRTCSCDEAHPGKQGDLTEHRGLSLEMACSWAEEVMERVAGKAIALKVAGKDASWRMERPNITLLREAWELGIKTQGFNKGDLTDAVEILTASARIDPVIAFMKMTQTPTEGQA